MRSLVLILLLLLAAVSGPAVAQSTPPPSGEFESKDKEGDVSLRSAPAGLPGGPLSQNIDITALRVHSEDTEGVWIDVKVKQLREATDMSMPGGRSYTIQFGLEQAFSYRATFRQFGGFANGTPAFTVDFYASPKTGGYGVLQRVSGTADYTNNQLTLYVPKLSLLGRNAAGADYAQQKLPDFPLKAGNQLVEFRVEASGQYLLGDRLPDSGSVGPYVLKHGLANDRIRVSLGKDNQTEEEHEDTRYAPDPDGAFPRVGVEAGSPTPIKLALENRNGAKRVINLTTAFADPKDASRFSVRMANTIAIPGNESRTMNLLVTALPGVKHRDEAILKVNARSIGFADELGALTLRLVASVPPSEATNVLHFHASLPSDDFFNPICGAPRVFPFVCESRLWMNTVEEDPMATGDKSTVNGDGNIFSRDSWTTAYVLDLDAPLARDLVLSAKMPIVGKIKVNGATADGSVRSRLMAGDLFIGEGNQVMKAGSEAVEVSFLPTLDATRIPAGSVLSYRVELTTPISNAPSAAMRPTIAFKESQLQLPVIADPNATAGVAPSLGDAFLSLTVKGDREEFVNPSEARAFQLTVLNEGAIEDVVTLAAIVDGDGCRAEFKPGDKYRLAPGDSARFGVLVYAPVNPKEGAQCKVHVNATSRVDPSTVASRDLLVTITRGVDTPNDADNYTSNQDAASKLDVERGGKKSPSAPIGPFILLLLAGVWAVRRRSQL